MDTPRRIAVCAHDAGGASALVPVTRELLSRGHEIVALLSGPAVRVFNGVSREPALNDTTPVEWLAAELTRRRVEVLVSASGLYNQIEHTARVAAASCDVPIVAVQDSWFFHDDRYRRGGVDSRPDAICVMDDLSRDEMLRIGFVPSQIVLTGHPGLEATRRDCLGASPEEILAKRRCFNVSERDLLLTFFSDPFYIGPGYQFHCDAGTIMRPDGSGRYGYTVRDILPAVLADLDAALETAGVDAQLIVRPHPNECDEAVCDIVAGFRGQRLAVHVDGSGTSIDWLQMSDVLIGMMTIALLQAALAGKPAISVQFGLLESGEADPCIANTLGYSRAVFNRGGLAPVCAAIARSDWPALRPTPHHTLRVEGAAAAVSDCVLRAAAAGAQ